MCLVTISIVKAGKEPLNISVDIQKRRVVFTQPRAHRLEDSFRHSAVEGRDGGNRNSQTGAADDF